MAVGLATTITGLVSANRPPSKGRIPEAAFQNGKVDVNAVPDYVVAYRRDGEIAGYVKKEDLFGTGGARRAGRIVVVDEATTSYPVGHMVPGRGFVALGQPDESVAPFEQESDEAEP